MSGGGDLFGALPDELLNHVLSFLPSREAVKASLLSRRWRHLWRSTPAVIASGEGDDFRFFLNSLLFLRDYTWWRPRSPFAFTSPHLTTLHLEHVNLEGGLLNFSRSPALTLVRCSLQGYALVSPSLQRLSLVNCSFEITKRISTPSLRCLQLSGRYFKDSEALFLKSESIPWMADPSIQCVGETRIYSRKR